MAAAPFSRLVDVILEAFAKNSHWCLQGLCLYLFSWEYFFHSFPLDSSLWDKGKNDWLSFICLFVIEEALSPWRKGTIQRNSILGDFTFTAVCEADFFTELNSLLECDADKAFIFPSTSELILINIVNIHYFSCSLKLKIREHFYVLGTKCFT